MGVSADTVLNLLREYEETHETIADRLLGRLVSIDPDTALSQLEAARAHLDARMVRSAPHHEFVPYRANPHICSVCGAVQPMPCYAIAAPGESTLSDGGAS